MGNGQWASGKRQAAKGKRQWAKSNRQAASGNGQAAMGKEQWAMGNGQCLRVSQSREEVRKAAKRCAKPRRGAQSREEGCKAFPPLAGVARSAGGGQHAKLCQTKFNQRKQNCGLPFAVCRLFFVPHARISLMTLPDTSVRRNGRPW